MYVKNLIKEIKTWCVVRSTAKENIEKLNEIGFDVDWVGRMYTLIDIPKELNDLPQNNIHEVIDRNIAIDLYVKNQLGPISELLNELRLSELVVYPEEYEQFEKSNTILFMLRPDRRYFTFFKVTAFLAAVGAVLTGAGLLLAYFLTR